MLDYRNATPRVRTWADMVDPDDVYRDSLAPCERCAGNVRHDHELDTVSAHGLRCDDCRQGYRVTYDN